MRLAKNNSSLAPFSCDFIQTQVWTPPLFLESKLEFGNRIFWYILLILFFLALNCFIHFIKQPIQGVKNFL
ncbi:hypothetical protein BGP_1465 [Beggiatoa sp. PS]|nr:hypothetical protein BGP_1465 [Beggiatoa sp. PS]